MEFYRNLTCTPHPLLLLLFFWGGEWEVEGEQFSTSRSHNWHSILNIIMKLKISDFAIWEAALQVSHFPDNFLTSLLPFLPRLILMPVWKASSINWVAQRHLERLEFSWQHYSTTGSHYHLVCDTLTFSTNTSAFFCMAVVREEVKRRSVWRPHLTTSFQISLPGFFTCLRSPSLHVT